MEPNSTRYVSDIQLEALYNINRRTWQQWRFRGHGPAYTKAGRLVRYDLRDVEAWLGRDKMNSDGTRLAA
jgi:Helix-turn-helix domain